MTVSSTLNRVTYTGNGVTTALAVSFPFQATTDLVVVETIIATGVQTTKTITTHYTVSGTTDSLGYYPNGGTVTAVTAPASTVRWTIYRDPAATQGLNLAEANALPAESVEAQFDYVTMLIQRVKDLANRSLRQPDGDSANISTVPSLTDRASKYMAFDASGNPVATPGTSETPDALLKSGGNLTGGINSAKTTVASATTPDIFATTVGDYVDYTGTVSCTGFVAAPQAGAERGLRCAGAAPFVAGANMLIDGYAGGETFTATADDLVIVRAETTTQFRLTIHKRNAKSIIQSVRSDGTVGGTADAITINYTPGLILADEPIICFVATGANTITNPTLAVNGGTARTWYKKGGTALRVGDIPGNLAVCIAKYNLANTRWELLNPYVTAPIFTSTFTSSEIAFGSAVTSTAHGMGVIPLLFSAIARCKTADGGYSVNDEVEMPAMGANGIPTMSLSADATNLTFTYSGVQTMARKDTGAGFTPTAASWKIVFRAYN